MTAHEGAAGFEFFDHTADVGIEAWGEDLPALLGAAGRGLFELMTSTAHLARTHGVSVEVEGHDKEDLLVCWLGELLFLFETRHFIPLGYEVQVAEESHRLSARLEGDLFDPKRHEPRREVKAITYHGVRVWNDGKLWRGRVVVDL